ncbi:MAG: hypothetical protein Q8P33_00925 [bacterium]|nr:hypothetical protein [bacterium]
MSPDHDEQYEMLGKVLRKKKIENVRASSKWFSQGKFTKYWRMQADGSWEQVNRSLRPSLVYDRMRRFDSKTGDFSELPYSIKREIARLYPFYNVPDLTELLDNKLYQAVVFSDMMPKTQLWTSNQVLQNPEGNNIVLKSVGGSGGQFVTITKKRTIRMDSLKIQQSFIKADPTNLRDFRVGIIGNKILYVYQRIAAQGSLYTNVHQGATMEFAKLKDVKNVTERAVELLKRLRMYRKKILSLDFMVDTRDNVPYLVESNSYPGTANFGAARLERYLTSLVNHILE